MRRDARERRERLVCAAAEVFEREGYHVPLEKIAAAAAVGRATLYRNFPDRTALAIAVIEAHIDGLAKRIELIGERTDAFFISLRELANLALATRALSRAVREEGRDTAWIDRLRGRVEALNAGPLARAKAAGLVRADFDIADVHMIAQMVAGGALDTPASGVPAGADRALYMLIQGLSPRPQHR
ncbi:MAG: TetR family transcriptional regulator [Pseudomonadota bacterium]